MLAGVRRSLLVVVCLLAGSRGVLVGVCFLAGSRGVLVGVWFLARSIRADVLVGVGVFGAWWLDIPPAVWL